MWGIYLFLSVSSFLFFAVLAKVLNIIMHKKGKRLNIFNVLAVGVFATAFFMFIPVHTVNAGSGVIGTIILSLLNSMKIFGLGTEFSVVSESVALCTEKIGIYYQVWAALIYVLAPIFTAGFVLSFFKNISAYMKYLAMYFREMYIFSELNEKSLTLASDIKRKNRKAGIVFNSVFEEEDKPSFELIERAEQIGAVFFKKDILAVSYDHHSSKNIFFFAIGENESENLNQTLNLIEKYKNRKNTYMYIFSTSIESELLLGSTLDESEIKVRKIDEVRDFVSRMLYDRGEMIFESAIASEEDGIKEISAVIVGMKGYGTEMVKALSWYGQMDGYRISIDAFDGDKLAEEKFKALAPELMSDKFNGRIIKGEPYYKIKINSHIDVESFKFANEISKLEKATYVFVSLGDDDMNIKTAVNLRMLFERMGIHPIIQAIISDGRRNGKVLNGVKNYRGQDYDIEFIGDIESSFTESAIINSELREDALQRHLKWSEEYSWIYEYYNRSSTAAAIHMKARVACCIPGADKRNEELSESERDTIELLEHRRWNAYMRSEGYVYSGSRDKKSRNDIAKAHPDLVDFYTLTDEDKRKDSLVGTK